MIMHADGTFACVDSMVEIGNHTPAAPPTPCDVAPSATCGDRLGASLGLDATARRGMLRGNLNGN
jgi:hypothetical protein